MPWKTIGVLGTRVAVNRLRRTIPREAQSRSRRGEPILLFDDWETGGTDAAAAISTGEALVARGAELIVVADHLEPSVRETMEQLCGVPVHDCVHATNRSFALMPLRQKRIGLVFSDGPAVAALYENTLRALNVASVSVAEMVRANIIYLLRDAFTGEQRDREGALRRVFETALRPFLTDPVDAVILGNPLLPPLEVKNASLPFAVHNPFDLLAAQAVQSARPESAALQELPAAEQSS